jgi:hypothetical protein
MLNKVKYAIGLLMIAFPTGVYSQINTYSPYSRFGIGQLAKPGLGQTSSMGYTGIALPSGYEINYLNPASYHGIDTLSFIFDFGVASNNTTYKSVDSQTKLKNFNIQHIAIGFPVTKWWKGAVGITPYSSVGYNISEEKTLDDVGRVDYFYNGNGGLNQFFIGSSFTFFKKLTLGVNMSTLFGYIDNNQHAQFVDKSSAAVTRFSQSDNIRGIMFNLGAQYTETIAKKYFITLSAIYNNQTSLKSTRTYSVTNSFPGSSFSLIPDTVINDNNGTPDTTIVIKTIDPNLDLISTETRGKFIYPRTAGFGFAFGIKNRLTLTGDYISQNWSDSRLFGKNDSLANSSSLRFGAELIPNPEALRGYLNHMAYRLGGYYTNSYIRIRGEQIKDYGITFGVGIPFKSTKTTFNLGVVLGQRGTLNNNLIKENYGIVNFSLVFHDFWFFKRKFD